MGSWRTDVCSAGLKADSWKTVKTKDYGQLLSQNQAVGKRCREVSENVFHSEAAPSRNPSTVTRIAPWRALRLLTVHCCAPQDSMARFKRVICTSRPTCTTIWQVADKENNVIPIKVQNNAFISFFAEFYRFFRNWHTACINPFVISTARSHVFQIQ